MSNPLGRIGKSLIKYFKPVRVAPPHYKTSPDSQGSSGGGGDSDSGFKLLKFKKPEHDKVAESKVLTRKGYDPIKDALPEDPQLPDKTPAHWLDMVSYLLAACRRVSTLMRRKAGVESYRQAVLKRGAQKLQTVGSIVDTTSGRLESEMSKDDKKAA